MGLLFNICLVIMIVTFAVGAMVYQRLNAAMRWALYVNAFSVITELAGNVAQSFIPNNRLIFSLANPIEMALLVMFFLAIIPQKAVRWFGILAIVFISVVTILDAFVLTQNANTYFFFIVLKGVVVSILCMIYFYNLFLSDKNFERPNINMIVLVTGFLFYYSFSTVYFSIFHYQMNHNLSLAAILKIRPFLYITYVILQCSILVTFVRILILKKVPEHAGHTE